MEPQPVLSRRAAPVAVGFVVAGLTSYGFLVLAARQLGPARYAALSALWVLIVLVGPGFFLPFEQELTRACALRRHHGDGVRPIVLLVVKTGAALTAVLAVATLVLSPALLDQVLDRQGLLLAALVLAIAAYCGQHIARGVLAGNGRLRGYGLLVGSEGFIRLAAAAGLVAFGVDSAGPFGVVVAAGTVAAVAIALLSERGLYDDGPPAQTAEVTASLGSLLVGSVLAQALLNAPPLAAKALAGSGEQALVGRFLAALVIARVPLFLFQAVQAALLPHLTKRAAADDRAGFRRTLMQLALGLGVLGVVGATTAAVIGSDVLTLLFGDRFSIADRDLAYLVAGTVLYMLALVAAHGLIAVHRQALATIGWAVGLAAGAVALLTTTDLLLRCELAFLVGSLAAAATHVALLARH